MDTNKKLLFRDEARTKILEGVEILADAVCVTLGPRGRNVVIERLGQAPHVTKDGVTVAKSINLKDQFTNIGAQMIKEVASQTVDVAGDGTTTATVLARSIYKNGLKLIAAGHNPSDLKRGIDKAVKAVCKALEENAIEVSSNNEIMHVGTVSANGDISIGEMLAQAMEKVGRDGVITIEEAKSYKTSMETVEGMQINRGYVSPFFVTNSEKLTAELINPYVFITNKRFEHMKDLISALEQVLKEKRSVLLIVDEIEGEALNSLTVNKMRGTLDICAIRAPEFGNARHDMLEDIEILTGGKIVSDATGINVSDIDLKDPEQKILGSAEKIIVGKNETTIVVHKDRKEAIDLRVQEIKKLMEDPTLSENEISIMKRRLARLAGGVAILRVGGATEVEMKEKKDRVEDALCATQAAVEAGIVPGGGAALIHASKHIDKLSADNTGEQAGMGIIREACYAPLQQIAKNADAPGQVVLHNILEQSNKNMGWHATKEEYIDLVNAGIIDPVKVPKTALENAASIAGLMLTIEAAIAEEDPNVLNRIAAQLGQ